MLERAPSLEPVGAGIAVAPNAVLPDHSPTARSVAMLVHIQDPGAHYVATPARWRELGRRLTPDARPLVILRPRGPVMIVFDVRHTEPLSEGSPPLPHDVSSPMAISTGLTDDEVSLRLGARRRQRDARRDPVTLADTGKHLGGTASSSRGVSLQRRPTKDGRPGDVHRLRYDVTVNRNDAPQDRLASLLHELGHIYCGHLGTYNPKHWSDRSFVGDTAGELEAETVAHIVLSRLDPHLEMGRYIESQLRRHDADVPPISLQTVLTVAGLCLQMADRRLPRRRD
ncbi:ImmA/IrrE family metallo-endopeptidase [Cellulosimicrobium sp. ES-005]|uniref:ImmA/IrrE family metallo-endopeptidase n=1 Tax=Cellulosimicrobium sp. ES-005 TaxID=3163031 RepID=A0AAU8G276_9MICO